MSGGPLGDARRVNDTSVGGCSELWRRIHPKQIIFDKSLGKIRPSSAAFQDSTDGTPMSVLSARLVGRSGRDEFSVLRSFPNEALAAFTARFARSQRQGIELAPVENEPAHAHVFGSKEKSVRSQFAKHSIWAVEPNENSQVILPPERPFRRARSFARRFLRARLHWSVWLSSKKTIPPGGDPQKR